jgi:hypothetical protein
MKFSACVTTLIALKNDREQTKTDAARWKCPKVVRETRELRGIRVARLSLCFLISRA